MTGQSILNLMEVINNESQLQAGEADVVRGLIALNTAQDYFEATLALFPHALGGQTGTVVTALNTESTAFPTGVLRIDKLQYIDPVTSRPGWDLFPLYEVGSHSRSTFWPNNLFVSSTSVSGKPEFFYTNGSLIYWSPLPDGVNTVRWYGLQIAADITAAGTFAYPDIVAFPLAAFAMKLLSMGVDDGVADLSALSAQAFGTVIGSLSRYNRTGAAGLAYTRHHMS